MGLNNLPDDTNLATILARLNDRIERLQRSVRFITPADIVAFTPTYYYGPEGGRASGTTVLEANTAAPLYVRQLTTFDRIGCEVLTGSAASEVRLGIYADNGHGAPGALVLDASTVPSDTIGVREIAIWQLLTEGLYWLTATPQGGTPAMRCLSTTNITPTGAESLTIATSATPSSGYYDASVAGALPDPYVVSGQTTKPILVVLRAA